MKPSWAIPGTSLFELRGGLQRAMASRSMWQLCSPFVPPEKLAIAVAINVCLKGFTDVPALFAALVSGLGVAGLEADRLRSVAAMRQSEELARGFAGSVRRAQSSDANDLRMIMGEIEEHGQADDIDDMVGALMTSNVSTRRMRLVIKLAGRLGDASDWSRAVFLMSASFLVFQCRQVYLYRIPQNGVAVGWFLLSIAVLEAILWPVLFLQLAIESKAFAERCVKLLLILLPGMIGLWGGVSYDATAHLCVIPLILVLSMMGPLRVIRMPVVGPALVRMLFGRSPCQSTVRPVQRPEGKESGQRDDSDTFSM
ncbi:unnamed protein product [Symbiodinium sp. CCMP2456]|nr:unnamed protein product [Symbiodinium sp. CCMP2456]